MKEWREDGQKWREGGGKMEETLPRWRKVEGDMEEKLQTFSGKNEKNCQVLV